MSARATLVASIKVCHDSTLLLLAVRAKPAPDGPDLAYEQPRSAIDGGRKEDVTSEAHASHLTGTLRADEGEITSAGPRLLSIDEVASYLGVSQRWVYDQVRCGHLPAMLIARSWRIRPDVLERFAESFLVSPGK